MEQKIIRTGIIGSGFAARFHYNALLRVFSAKIEIIGVFSIAHDELQEFTCSRNLKAFENLDDLIRDSDMIHVCTPPVSHEKIVISALEQNKNVIVEKPFTGYFGEGIKDFNGDTFSREEGHERTIESISRMLAA